MTDWSKLSKNSTNWTKGSSESTDFAQVAKNSTMWRKADPTSLGTLMLQDASYLLYQDGSEIALQ